MRNISFRNDVMPLKDVLYRLALRITLNREEAKVNVKSGRVTLENIKVGYFEGYYTENTQRAYPTGTYHDKNGHIFDVKFEMDKDDIISMSCMAPRCN